MTVNFKDDELKVVRKETFLDNLLSRYKRAVRDLRHTPQNIVRYKGMFCEILNN